MAINDFTGQNIKDTYQRVVQTDGTNVTDGTGSLLPISFDGNNVVISGSLSATEYIVTSSVTNVVFQQQSGSTIFGDSIDDVHQFTGSVSMSQNLHVVGDISASSVFVNATTLTIGNQPLNQADLANLKVGKSIISDESTLTINTTDSEDNVSNSANYIRPQMWIHNSDNESALIHNTAHSLHFRTAGGDPFRIHTDNNTNNFVRLGTFAGSNIILRGNVTASSNISASGDILGDNLTVASITNTERLQVDQIDEKNAGDGIRIMHNITASNNITASGDIHAGDFYIKQGGKIINERFQGNFIQINQGQMLFKRGTSDTASEVFRIGSTGFIINEGSLSTTQADFRVESATDTHNIFSDASADKVGIGTSTLTEKLTVDGNIQATGFITASILSASTEIHTPILKGIGTATGFHVDGFISSSHITSSGNISASGNLLINQITASGDIKLTEDARINFDNETSGDQYITGRDDYLTVDGDEILHLRADNYVNLDSDSTRATHITASGEISASGTIHAGNLHLPEDGILYFDNDGNTGNRIECSGNPEDIKIYADRNVYISPDSNVIISTTTGGGGNIATFDGTNKSLELAHASGGHITASGEISASGKFYSSNKEVFQNTFQCLGDSSFASSAYGPNTQGLNYYYWNRNWTTTTSDGGNPTGDGIHKAELNSGWHVPYDIRIISFSGGITDPGNTETDNKSASLGLWVSSNPIGFEDYTSNDNDTKNFLCSGSVLINGNKWKTFKNYTSSYDLSEGQVVFPRMKMEKEYDNLRGQFTIHYIRRK